MANGHENLLPTTQRSKEEAREMGRKGGIKSGKVRKEKKMLAEICLKMLNSPLGKEQADKLKLFKGLKSGDMTFNAGILATQMKKALSGDINAAKFLQEVSGQKEAEKQDINLSGNIFDGIQVEVIDKREQVEKTEDNEATDNENIQGD